ncbi:MAG: HAMP domain-containing sensor histidine kinase, partial [Holophaga sp.]
LSSDPAPVTPAFLGGLLEDCDQLGALIEQILFLAKSGDGQNNVAMEPLSALELLEETRAFFEAAAEERNVTLQVVSEIEVSFQGNRLLLLRAFHNLVSNALKHTREAGCVQLGARAELERVCLWVQDDGNGIPSNWIARLGTPFLKGPSSASRDGLGLGLAIVRRVAHLHGGEMQIQSAVGQGTRVELHLPRLCRL